MTDRKWRIIYSPIPKDFYAKIEKYERQGYELIPESFGLHNHFYALMRNKKFKD